MKQSSDYFLNDKKVKATFCFYGEGKNIFYYFCIMLGYGSIDIERLHYLYLLLGLRGAKGALSLGFAQLAFAMKSVTHTQTYIHINIQRLPQWLLPSLHSEH